MDGNPIYVAPFLGLGVALKAPTADGSANQVIKTDGSGNLSFVTIASGITIDSTAITSGAATRILFENASNQVSESSGLTWDGGLLTVFEDDTTSKLKLSRSADSLEISSFKIWNTGNDLQISAANNLDLGAAGTTGHIYVDTGGLVGIRKSASLGACLDVGPKNATTITGIFTGGVSSSVDLVQFNPDAVTAGTRARITSAGEFSNSFGVTGSEAFGDGSVIGAGHTYSTVFGNGNTTGSTYQTLIGNTVVGGSGQRVVGIGQGITFPGGLARIICLSPVGTPGGMTSNGFYAGSPSAIISDIYFGEGAIDATPTDITFHGTGGSGTDIAGADITIAGGKGTGDAAGGDILFQTSDAGASGTTLQSLSTAMTIEGNTGNVTIPAGTLAISGAGAAEIPLSVEGAAAQSVDLSQWNPNGVTVGRGARITKDGEFSNLGIGSGANNELFGEGSGAALTTGADNVIFGKGSGAALTSSFRNILIGPLIAPTASSSFNDNIFIGKGSATNAQTGDTNIGLGSNTLLQMTTAAANIAIGHSSLYRTVSGTNNIAIGTNAGTNFGAGASLTGGDYNILIGDGSGVIADGDNGIAIGRNAVTDANALVVGSTTVAVSNVYFGKGITNATPTAYTINGTGGSGTDIAGADITIGTGAGTGDGLPGSVLIKSAPADVGAGATLNDLSSTVIEVSANATVGTLGFYGATPVAQQTGVAVSAAAIHAALVSLGLITA